MNGKIGHRPPPQRMVVKTFRVHEDVWAAVEARCEAERVKPSDVIRDLLHGWAVESD